jgi:hypothetical protein
MSTEGVANLVKFSKILARWNDLFLTRSRHTQHPFSINVWAGILGHTVHNVIEEYCDERGIYTFYFITIAEIIHLKFNKVKFVLTISKLFLCNLCIPFISIFKYTHVL